MIDVHSHLIFDVDDGPSTLKESIRMVLEAEKLGISTIIATPHYQENLFNVEKARDNFNELLARVSGCNVDIYMGSEIFITPALPEVIKKNRALTLNGSKYLLFELPFDVIPPYSYEVIYKLHLDNFIPIIAHPERNRYFVNNFNLFLSVIEKGCLVQVDAASINGIYGSEVKNFVKKLIKLGIAGFVASDAHCSEDYVNWYTPAYKKVRSWVGTETADKLFNENPKMIIKNTTER